MGNKVKEQVFDWAMKIMTITKLQEVLLRFIAVALFPSLFVIGAILRTFAFTRKLGGLLLAMAIALYFVFPAFYAFGALVMLDLKNQAYQNWQASPQNPARLSTDPTDSPRDYPDPPIANSMYNTGNFSMIGGSGTFSVEDAKDKLRNYEGLTSDQYMDKVQKARDVGQASELLPSWDLSKNVQATDQQKNQSLKSAWTSGMSWLGEVSKRSRWDYFVSDAWLPNGPLDSLARITFWSMFFSFLSVIATIASIRSLSITFGGDIEIAGLTRLI